MGQRLCCGKSHKVLKGEVEMTIYGIIKCEYDYHAAEWYHNAEHIEVFRRKEDRDARVKFLDSQTSEFDRVIWSEFDVDLQ